MQGHVLKLADLDSLKEELRVEEVICPKHPDDSKKKLRVGVDKRGRFCQFIEFPDVTGPGKWVQFRPCSAEDIAAILLFYGNNREECRIDHYRGPPGWEMLYYIGKRP